MGINNNGFIMKKLLLILLCLPMIGFGQQNSNQMGNSMDAAINTVLEYTFKYLIKDNFYTPNGEFKISTKKDSIERNLSKSSSS